MVAFGDPARARSNIAAWNLINQVNGLNREIAIRQLRLATGKQQPRVEDGASFFAIWNKMRNQVRGKEMALDNVGDAKDELSLAEAGMLRVDELLGRMRDLVVRSGNDSLTAEQREDIRQELKTLYMAIGDTVKRTRFNEGGEGGDALLDGFSHTYQVGPNEPDKFEVKIQNIMAGVTGAFSPEMGEKMEKIQAALDGLSRHAGESVAAELRDFAEDLEGNIKWSIEKLANSFEDPKKFQSDFLISLSNLSIEEMEAMNGVFDDIFAGRVFGDSEDKFKDFLTSEELAPVFLDLSSTLSDLVANPVAMDSLAAELAELSTKLKNDDMEESVKAISDSINAINETFKTAATGLEGIIDNVFGSEAQRLTLAQDIVFFAQASPLATTNPNVQDALNQLALDVANDADGLPNFIEALGALSETDRQVALQALSSVATDSENGLAFHTAVVDLDGDGGPFGPSGNFVSYVLNIEEKTFTPTDDVNMVAVLTGAANAVAGTFPGTTAALNNVIGLMSDDSDINDDALAQAINIVGQQIVNETADNGNMSVVLADVADALSVQFPQVSSQVNNLAAALVAGNPQEIANAVSTLGGVIKSETGTSNFFTNPVSRGSIRNAFLAQTGTLEFARLSPVAQTLFTNMANSLVGTLDLNGPGGPLSPETPGTLGNFLPQANPATSTNLVAREILQAAFRAQTQTAEFASLSPETQQSFLAMADGLTTIADLHFEGAPFSQTPGTFGRTLTTGIKETDPATIPPEPDLDDVNLASMFQIVAGNVAEAFPDISGLLNNASILLTDDNDDNDELLGLTLQALGGAIEAATGGENVDGPARAELRRAFLEATASQAFDSLSFPGKAAYLTVAEQLGAYTTEQVQQLDTHLDTIAAAINPVATDLNEQLAALGQLFVDPAVGGEDRDTFIDGLTKISTEVPQLEGNADKLASFHNALDNLEDAAEANPSDVVGRLSRFLPKEFLDLFANPDPDVKDLGDCIRDMLKLEHNTDAMMLIGGADDAINFVKDELIHLAGSQTKLTGLENILSESIVSEDSVASRFGDADLAKEQAELTKLQLFSQLATAQSAAANVAPSQLIGGLIGR
jgi:flagellin